MPDAKRRQDYKRRYHKSAESHRAVADSFRAANIPDQARNDECGSDCRTVPSSDKFWCESFEIAHEEERIQSHVKYRRCERLPSFLKPPEISESTLDPNVKSAIVGD